MGSQSWFREFVYRAKQRVVSSSALKDALDTLAAIALYDGALEEVHLRVGVTGEGVVIDLGRDDGALIQVVASGWSLLNTAPVRMWRSPGFGALPDPVAGGDVDEFRRLLGLDEEAWLLILGFLISALRPVGPYFCLLIEGEQGSGKSFLCSMIKRVIDPHQLGRMRMASSERDLMIHAKSQHLLVYDNISGMPGEMSDALCVLATGGGLATRRLYTDDEQQLFVVCRPFIINGIADFVNRPDLLERAILVNLPSMPQGMRKTESELNAEFDRIRPAVLGRLYDAVAHALRYEKQTPAPPDFRMADAARWITAAEPALGLKPGTIVDAIAGAQGLAMVERVQNNPLIIRLEELLEKEGPFEGTVGQLFDQVVVHAHMHLTMNRTLPATPAHLSRALRRLRPAAAKAGINIEFGDRHRDGKAIRIWRNGEEERKPTNWRALFQKAAGCGEATVTMVMLVSLMARLPRKSDKFCCAFWDARELPRREFLPSQGAVGDAGDDGDAHTKNFESEGGVFSSIALLGASHTTRGSCRRRASQSSPSSPTRCDYNLVWLGYVDGRGEEERARNHCCRQPVTFLVTATQGQVVFAINCDSFDTMLFVVLSLPSFGFT